LPFGFYIIMAAQFCSALADNALLIVAIAALRDLEAPPEYEPLLKFFFTISYVGLAAFVGAFADSMPKWRVMFISNNIKITGCALMFLGVHPLIAYGIVGLGAAAYSPAKYGILTEYLPHRLLVVANGWIEGLTVGAIIFGVVLGGMLISPKASEAFLSLPLPIDFSHGEIIIFIIGLLYLMAAVINLYIPDTGVAHKPLRKNPFYLIHEFHHCVALLWRDKLGQISLAVTTMLWGAAATLQFIVINWAESRLEMELSRSSMLQGVVAIGVTVGAILAASMISLKKSVRVLPIGVALGVLVCGLNFVHDIKAVVLLLVLIGALSGFFVVPMNALLQHRGHILMGAGHSIAVQNFNENLSILVMTAFYYLMIKMEVSITWIIVLFGFCMSGVTYLTYLRHQANQRQQDNLAYLEDVIHLK
jgi:hypothetical protein